MYCSIFETIYEDILHFSYIDHFVLNDQNYLQSSSVPLHSPSSSVSASSFSECEDSVLSLSDAGSDFTLSPSPSPEVSYTSAQQPLNWSVDDVWKYIRSLPGEIHFNQALCLGRTKSTN